MQTIFAQACQRLPRKRGARLCVLATGAMQPISELGIGELRIGNWESEIQTQFRHSLFAFRNRVPQNQLLPWSAEVMCSPRRKIAEIGGSVAHHLQMMCIREGENGLSMRVCASNAIHPAMMCSSGGENSRRTPPLRRGLQTRRHRHSKTKQGKALGHLASLQTSPDILQTRHRLTKTAEKPRFLAMPSLQTHEAVPG